MLTLDEAISHSKNKAKELYDEAMFVHANPNDEKLDACIECANEHQQLAEWLTELKAYRELFTSPKDAEDMLNQFMV